ncbi:MAG: YciI family protein [Micromonosporaceae bacterium]
MRYLFLLYGDEPAEQAMDDAALKAVIEAHGALVEQLRAEGRYHGGAGLDASSTATMVTRTPDGDDQITDGPYTESKEQVGGLYLVECADLDEAIKVAQRIPYSPGLRIEVRPAPY